VPKASPAPTQRALVILTGTVVGVVVVTFVYWAQVVFVPVALAVFLTFLLSPLVLALQHRGLGRIPSLVVVMTLATLVLMGLVGVVTYELSQLAADLPSYTENVKTKITRVQELTAGEGTKELGKMLDEIFAQLQKQPAVEAPAPLAKPTRVVLEPESHLWLSRLPGQLGGVLEPLGAVAMAVVLAIFMLLKREDLRNRFIRLTGHGSMTVTTKAVDEAGERISRFLLMQLIVNGTYGLAWGLGLYFIGVDYALLWGTLAALLRYVPYIGAPVAAIMPLALSLVMFGGWTQPILAVILLVVLELVSNNVIEPWLYGQSIGVSEVALLVAAAFWAFLWGPIGLVLSGPLTVCLVVLGRYVPQLEFFAVILGDEPAFEPQMAYYQRLLAGDQDEAEQLVQTYVKTSGPEQVYDALLLPALTCVKRDRGRDELDADDELFVVRVTREIVEDLGERQAAAAAEEAPAAAAGQPAVAPKRLLLMGCPARDEADRLALEMLAQSLDPAQWTVEVLPETMPVGELVGRVTEQTPAVVCIGSLPPGGLARTRYLCKRLRGRLPHAKVVVGRWGQTGNLESTHEQLRELGVDRIVTTLTETQAALNGWLSALAPQNSAIAEGTAAPIKP